MLLFCKFRFFSIFLFFFIFTQISFSVCYFEIGSNSDCERFNEPFNEFKVIGEKISDAKIFLKDNPSFILQLKIENNSIFNQEPFTRTGLYEILIYYNDSLNQRKTKAFKFIFDNSKPLPPVINYRDNNFVYGETQFPNMSVFLNSNKIAKSSEENTFNFSLENLQTPLALIYAENIFNVSSKVHKYAFQKNFIENVSVNVSSIQISDLSNVFFSNNLVKTSNKNYTAYEKHIYVEGVISPQKKGVLVYVNGQRVLTNERGIFGVIHTLHKGKNLIEVIAKDEKDEVEILFADEKNLFAEISGIEKIIDKNSDLTFNVDVSNRLVYEIFLNGELIESKSGLENILISKNKLKNGRNILTLKTFDSIFSKTFYVDFEEPKIEILKSDEGTILFKVEDDTGVKANSVKVFLEEKIFSDDNIEKFGKYYKIETEDFGDFEIQAEDRVGNSVMLFGVLNQTLNPKLSKVIFEDLNSFSFGDVWFVSKSSNKKKVQMNFSENVVFDRIYLDGEEITDYEITRDFVNLYLKFEKDSGVLDFRMAGSDKVIFTKKIKYITKTLDTKIKTFMPISLNEDYNLYSGEIENEYLNLTSLRINSNEIANVFTFGKNFEFITSKNFLSDNKNLLVDVFLKSRIKDESLPKFVDSSAGFVYSENFFTIENSLKLIELQNQNSFGSVGSKLSVVGKGYEILPFNFNLKSDLNSKKQTVYIDKNFIKITPIIKDGSYVVLLDGLNIYSTNLTALEKKSCSSEFIALSNSCFSFDNKQDILITAENNLTFEVLKSDFEVVNNKYINNKIYVKDVQISLNNIFITGLVYTSGKINSVKFDSSSCFVREEYFFCNLVKNLVKNNSIIYFETFKDGSITLNEKNFDVDLYFQNNSYKTNLSVGMGVANLSNSYFIVSDEFNFELESENLSLVQVFLGGEEVFRKKGNISENITLKRDFLTTDDILEKTFEVKVINTKTSKEKDERNFFNITYKKFFEVFLEVFIN